MRFIGLLLLVLLIFSSSTAQHSHSHIPVIPGADTTAPYLKSGTIPTFSIKLADSSWFSSSQLNQKKPLLLVYFSPDCGHCITETEEMISRMNHLKKIQIVLVTSKTFDEMKSFHDFYKLERFENIKTGVDPQKKITRFYQVKFTPFSALYSRKGKLLKAYESGIEWDELIGLVNEKR